MFSVIYRFNQGTLRCFLFAGSILGAVLCRGTVADLFERILVFLCGIPVNFVKFSTKRLLFLFKRCSILKQRGSVRLKKSKRKKSKKRITNNYLGMAVISVVVLLLLGGLAMKSHSLRNRIAYYDAQAAELKQQISDEKERTKEIDKRTEYMQTDEYAAEVARDRLGLVKDNEIVFEEEK